MTEILAPSEIPKSFRLQIQSLQATRENKMKCGTVRLRMDVAQTSSAEPFESLESLLSKILLTLIFLCTEIALS